jgi:hypothetical protein
MWQLILGFALGAYTATHFDLKPYIERATEFAKQHLPNKRE